ncbi:hypothetical protein [Nonomuraea sp. CA-141351]
MSRRRRWTPPPAPGHEGDDVLYLVITCRALPAAVFAIAGKVRGRSV